MTEDRAHVRYIKPRALPDNVEIVESPFRGAVHNMEVVQSNEELLSVHTALYAAVIEEETTIESRITDPIYSKLYLIKPTEEDIAESGK